MDVSRFIEYLQKLSVISKESWTKHYAAFAILVLGFLLLYLRIDNGSYGWDFQTYQTAVQIWLAGQNPYNLQTLEQFGHTYPYVYPPIILPVLALFTIPTEGALWLYLLEYSALMIGCATLLISIAPTDNSLLIQLRAVVLLITGFAGGYWIFWSGNLDFGILFLICIGLYLAHTDRWFSSGIALGIAGAVKIIPLIAGGVYLLVDEPLRDRIRAVAGLVTGPLIIFAGSALLFPHLFPSEFLGAVAQEGGVTQFIKEGSVVNFPMLYLWQELFEMGGLAPEYGIVIHAIFTLIILGAGILWIRTVEQSAIQLALGMIGVLLIYTRLKPYYMVYAIPAVFLITAYQERQTGNLIHWEELVLVAYIPMVSEVVYFALGRSGVRALHPLLTILLQYTAVVALLTWAMYRFPYLKISKKLQTISSIIFPR